MKKFKVVYGRDLYEQYKNSFDAHPEALKEVKEAWDKPVALELTFEEEE